MMFKIGDRVVWSSVREFGMDISFKGTIYAVSPQASWEWWIVADEPHKNYTHNAQGRCPKGNHSRYVREKDLTLLTKRASGFGKWVKRIENG